MRGCERAVDVTVGMTGCAAVARLRRLRIARERAPPALSHGALGLPRGERSARQFEAAPRPPVVLFTSGLRGNTEPGRGARDPRQARLRRLRVSRERARATKRRSALGLPWGVRSAHQSQGAPRPPVVLFTSGLRGTAEPGRGARDPRRARLQGDFLHAQVVVVDLCRGKG